MKPHQRLLVVVAAVLLALAASAPFASPYVIILITHALIFAILAMSVDLLLGYTGLPSLGQAAYLGMGAYLTAILATKFQLGLDGTFWIIVVLGMLIGAATAAFFGLFAIRATGVYFLMITLALGMCVWGLAYRWNSVTGGDNGIVLPPRPQFWGIDLANDLVYFYLVFAFFVAALAALYLLVQSPFGRSLVGIRENELRMRILGYNTWLHKYIAFVIAGAFGGVAGVLWAHSNGLVSPEDVILATSVDALLMVVLGGPGTLVGGAIGASVVVFLREYLSTLVPWWQYVLGAVYVLTILYLPGGLMGLPERMRRWRESTPPAKEAKEVQSVSH
ncbi:MAG TPA: branched-chain amino acid ABC transporter permease [Burkholderiales bacterium]|nr:branched-chain amino acid ABC transporter permease [Burkholderiales bacterium]